MTIALTTRNVADTLARIASDQPDRDGSGRVNNPSPTNPDVNTCLYLYPNGTRCIAGQALANLGVPASLFEREHDGIDGVIERLTEDGVLTCHDNALELLRIAQDLQDERAPWSEAVSGAFREVGVTHPNGA